MSAGPRGSCDLGAAMMRHAPPRGSSLATNEPGSPLTSRSTRAAGGGGVSNWQNTRVCQQGRRAMAGVVSRADGRAKEACCHVHTIAAPSGPMPQQRTLSPRSAGNCWRRGAAGAASPAAQQPAPPLLTSRSRTITWSTRSQKRSSMYQQRGMTRTCGGGQQAGGRESTRGAQQAQHAWDSPAGLAGTAKLTRRGCWGRYSKRQPQQRRWATMAAALADARARFRLAQQQLSTELAMAFSQREAQVQTPSCCRHMVQAHGAGTWCRHMLQAHAVATWCRHVPGSP